MKNAATALLCVILMIAFFIVYYGMYGRGENINLAQYLESSLMDDKKTINLSNLGYKVCVSPPIVGPYGLIQKEFRTFDIKWHSDDKSEGVWYIGVQNNATDRTVHVYAVQQSEIEWPLYPEEKASNLIFCNKKLDVFNKNGSLVLEIQHNNQGK